MGPLAFRDAFRHDVLIRRIALVSQQCGKFGDCQSECMGNWTLFIESIWVVDLYVDPVCISVSPEQ